jgi:hypothetical protein
MKHGKFFRTHLVFTSADLASYLESTVATGARMKESLLEYHRKSGHLIQIRATSRQVVYEGIITIACSSVYAHM